MNFVTLCFLISSAFCGPINSSAPAAPPAPVTSSTQGVQACEYEDSVACVWDARHMGNGRGKSFRVDARGNVKYITHRRAHYLTH